MYELAVDREKMNEQLPAAMKQTIAKKKLKFYNIDAVKIAREVGLGGRINMVSASRLSSRSPRLSRWTDAVVYIKQAIKDTYGRKGDKIVNMNIQAVDRALEALKRLNIRSPGRPTTGAEGGGRGS